MKNMTTIKSITVSEPMKYIWLKYVTGVDLSNHCAKCLKGAFSNRLDATTAHAEDIKLDEAKANIFYLCGVSQPFRWVKNFHLAFRHKEGETLEFKSNGIHVIIENAERIKFSSDDIAPDAPNIEKKAYSTCRNWQFAHKVASELS